MISQILFESIALFFFLQVLQIDAEQLTTFPNSFLTAWSYYLSVILLTVYMNKKRITLANIIKLYQRFNLTVLLWVWLAVLLIITINSIVVFYTMTYPTQEFKNFSTTIVFGLPLLSAVLASYMVFRIAKNIETLTMRQTEEVYLEHIDELITHFRSQRHDFLNHLQVIYGLAKLGNMEGVIRYLEDLNLEADETLSLLQLKHPPMAALLQAKAATAIVKHIQFKVKVNSSLEELTIRPFELVKVIGNIIDNAFDEEIKVPEFKRYVDVIVEQQEGSYIAIHVFNRNSYIAPEECELIFRQGYTSKEENHSGTGLAVSRQIIRKYSGNISITSDPERGTCFTVTLPTTSQRTLPYYRSPAKKEMNAKQDLRN
jgi:signal transduction histidine kinase